MQFVFVHLGPAKAKYLPSNLKRLQKIFPEVPTTLIHTEDVDRRLLRLPKVRYYEYLNTNHQTLSNLVHDEKFRRGFWFHSLERIFALSEWAQASKESRFLHVESDVLLLPTFPISFFESLNSLAWTRFNQGSDVATFIYSPDSQQASWLSAKIQDFVRSNETATDMTALSAVSHEYPKSVYILPSDFSDTESSHIGIFDPAQYGMWLTGEDPRNHFGMLKRYVNHAISPIQPSKNKYKFENLNELRVIRGNDSLLLHNLHIHSKRRSLFGPFWRLRLWADIKLSSNQLFPNRFSPLAFMAVLKDVQKRHPTIKSKALLLYRVVRMKAH
jgi:hypothetical protein